MRQGQHDALYTDPRLVALYDALNAGERDYQFYQHLMGDSPRRIVDVGCGSGRFAVRLAAQGHQVVALDPAPAMLSVARAREGGAGVDWREGGVESLAVAERFDYAVMTGHAVQCLLDDKALLATLRALCARLLPGGRFLFESRNPLLEPWRRWRPDASRRAITTAAGESVEVWYDGVALHGERLSFDEHYRFALDDTEIVSSSCLRFIGRERLADHLFAAGFAGASWYGDWDGSPWRPDSPEIIVAAQVGG
ncbi:class I SAM-dependent methyltransferase [Paludibacterium yongneupense]|uniref:class I SAM-dependent methyltransferase n=1 Tax=Paludibacterium yongneupense TaxID=400061 RepID=UPI0004128617|nr:class I SAM-dependent methyltransferase [Paludibacterium yongneupense]